MSRILENREDLGVEFPHGDLLQVVLPIPFLVVWGLDSFVYHISTFLASFIPTEVHLVLAGFSISLGFLLMGLSHQLLFGEIRDPPTILDIGVFAKVRHPMYLGILLIYVGFTLATFSIISLGLWVGIFFLYDKMATYEEEDLIRMFGDVYLNYQNYVPKWLPRIASPETQKGLRAE